MKGGHLRITRTHRITYMYGCFGNTLLRGKLSESPEGSNPKTREYKAMAPAITPRRIPMYFPVVQKIIKIRTIIDNSLEKAKR